MKYWMILDKPNYGIYTRVSYMDDFSIHAWVGGGMNRTGYMLLMTDASVGCGVEGG